MRAWQPIREHIMNAGRMFISRLTLCMAVALVAMTGSALAAQEGAAQDATSRIYVTNEYGGSVTVIDAESGKVIDTIHVAKKGSNVRPRGIDVSPDGRTIYVAISDFNRGVESDEDKIAAIDVKTNKVIETYYTGSDPERLAVSPDGTQLWASN